MKFQVDGSGADGYVLPFALFFFQNQITEMCMYVLYLPFLHIFMTLYPTACFFSF